MIHTTTNNGLHDFVGERVLSRILQFLPLSHMRLREHLVFSPNGFQLTRKPITWGMRIASSVLPGPTLTGDNHVLVLEAGV
jgi:hypothetical protein